MPLLRLLYRLPRSLPRSLSSLWLRALGCPHHHVGWPVHGHQVCHDCFRWRSYWIEDRIRTGPWERIDPGLRDLLFDPQLKSGYRRAKPSPPRPTDYSCFPLSWWQELAEAIADDPVLDGWHGQVVGRS